MFNIDDDNDDDSALHMFTTDANEEDDDDLEQTNVVFRVGEGFEHNFDHDLPQSVTKESISSAKEDHGNINDDDVFVGLWGDYCYDHQDVMEIDNPMKVNATSEISTSKELLEIASSQLTTHLPAIHSSHLSIIETDNPATVDDNDILTEGCWDD